MEVLRTLDRVSSQNQVMIHAPGRPIFDGRTTKQPGLSTRPQNSQPLAVTLASTCLLLRGGRRRLLLDLALEFERARREFGGLGFQHERIEAAAMVDASERVGGHAQAHVAAERV